MAFKFERKEMYPIFVFAKCCWSIHSKVVRFGKHAHSKQRKATPTQTLQFHVKFTQPTCPASSASIQCIFSTYGLVWSNIRNSLDAEKAEKLVKIYRFTELKKITSRLYSNCSSLSNFIAVRFVSLKIFTVNCTSVLLILLSTSQYIFRRKRRVGFMVGFIGLY